MDRPRPGSFNKETDTDVVYLEWQLESKDSVWFMLFLHDDEVLVFQRTDKLDMNDLVAVIPRSVILQAADNFANWQN